MRKGIRTGFAALVLPLVAVSTPWLVGCSGASAAVTAEAGNPAVQVTGTQLAAALVPASMFPRGYQLARNVAHDSGNRLEGGTAAYDPETMSCAEYYHANGRAGFGETAFA